MMLCFPPEIKRMPLYKKFFKKYKVKYISWQKLYDKANYISQHRKEKQIEKIVVDKMYQEAKKKRKEMDKWMHNQFKRKDFRDAGIFRTLIKCGKKCPYWKNCKGSFR